MGGAVAFGRYGSYGNVGGWNPFASEEPTAAEKAAVQAAVADSVAQARAATAQAMQASQEMVAASAGKAPSGTATPTPAGANDDIKQPMVIPWGTIGAVGGAMGLAFVLTRGRRRKNPGNWIDSAGRYQKQTARLGVGTAAVFGGLAVAIVGGPMGMAFGVPLAVSGYKTITGEKLDIPVLKQIPALINPRKNKARRRRRR